MTVVLGAGVGGQIVAKTVKNSDYDVTLTGPEASDPGGLFYLSKRIPGVSSHKVVTTYRSDTPVDVESSIRYQIKSRGTYDKKVKVSSLSKVGTSEEGYILDSIDISGVVRISQKCKFIDLDNQYILVEDSDRPIFYDRLISTIPVNEFFKLSEDEDITSSLAYQPIHLIEEQFEVLDTKVTSIITEYDLSSSDIYRRSWYCNKSGKTIKSSYEAIVPLPFETRIMYPGKILPSDKVLEMINDIEQKYPNVKLLGRYARWDYHWMINQTYSEAKKFINHGGKLNGKN